MLVHTVMAGVRFNVPQRVLNNAITTVHMITLNIASVLSLTGSQLGVPTNVFVQGCPKPETCVLHKGVNVSFGLDFKTSTCI